MPNFFSIAGIRTVGKPKPQVPPGNQNSQNRNPNEANAASNSSNEGIVTSATTTSSQSKSTNPATTTTTTTTITTTNEASKPSQPQSLFHKYPGCGKLTIQKKKGKTGFTKSSIRRVPIYNEDYDSSDDEEMWPTTGVHIPERLLLQTEEAILIYDLDAQITRQEEQELLQQWDDDTIAQGYADLMQRLWINIEHAAYLEQCAAKPSAVLIVEDDSNKQTNNDRPLFVMPESSRRAPSKFVFHPTIGASPTERKQVEVTGEVDFCKASINLPRYLDQEHKILAFTRAEFYTGVIQPFEKECLKVVDKSLVCGWQACLVVSEEDPFSYVLQARGRKDALEELKIQAEKWVQDRIRVINSHMLLQDGASVVIDSPVQPRLVEEHVKREKRAYKEQVLQVIETRYGWIDKQAKKKKQPPSLSGWKVKVHFKLYPGLCAIDASGSPGVLTHLSEATRNWVQTQSLYAISDSVECSQLTTSGRGTIKRIRITFRYPRFPKLGYVGRETKLPKTQVRAPYSKCGVWLDGIRSRTLLSYMMGEPAAFEKGCTLLSIDRKECNSPNDVQYIYEQEREMDRNCVELTLCLSRYTNFESIPELMDMQPKRLDGKPFNLSDYENPESAETGMLPVQKQQQQPAVVEQQAAVAGQPPDAEQPPDIEKLVDVEQPVDAEEEPDGNVEQPEFDPMFEGAQHQEPTYVPQRVPLEETGKNHEVWLRGILENEMSIEVEIILSSTESLGASCSTACVDGGGVLLFLPKKDGQLQRALGNASYFNLVLWKVNGVVVKHLTHLQELKGTASSGERPLHCILVMHEGTDLSQVDQSKLVAGKTPNPRRRNGGTCSLPQQLPPTKTSVPTVASRQDQTEDSEEGVDFSAEWDINDDDSSKSDDSQMINLKKKKKITVSKQKSVTSKTTFSKASTAKMAATSRKAKGKDVSNLDPFNDSDSDSDSSPLPFNDADSDSDLSHHMDLSKRKRKAKRKHLISKASAANTTSTTGKRASQSAESAGTGEAPVPKKARTISSKKPISDRSTCTSGSTASMNPSHSAKPHQMKAVSQNTTSVSQKASNTSLDTTSRGSNTVNLSARATSTSAASDPLAELLATPSKPQGKQKRAQSTQSIEEPAAKKHRGSYVAEANRNAARRAIPRRKSNEPKGSGLMQEYEATFIPTQPIGAYFKTEGSKCKIFSVFKKGKAREDGKIMPGTIAVAASISGKRQEVSSHEQLTQMYSQARKRRSKIHIFFVNTDVFEHPMDMQSDRDWTEYGVWTNRYEGGWAGGAATKNGVAYMTNKLTSERQSAAAANRESLRTENGTSRREKTRPMQKPPVWGIGSMREPSDPKPRKRLGPCIKDPKRPRAPSNVKFSDSNPVRYFLVGSATHQWHDPSQTASDEIATGWRPVSPADALKDAVMNHGYTKLIEVLETGVTSELEVISNMLPNHYANVKRAAREEKERSRKEDMEAKKKAITIYLNVCQCIEQAMGLQQMTAFKFCVKTVELKKKPKSSTVGRTELLSGKVFFEKYGEGQQELGSLHKTNTKAFISYDETELRVFLANCNPALKLSKHTLSIDFRPGAGGDAVPAAKLGNVKIPLSEIDRQCPLDGPLLFPAVWSVKPESIVSEGSVEIEFRKSKALQNVTAMEKENLKRKLKDQISFIKRFNDDFCGGRITISGNIRSIGNATLLHAAIHLQQEDMVKQLLAIGASPRVKSRQHGTPILQAMTLKDRTLEKLQNLINNGQKPEVTEPVQQLFELYSRILSVLKSNEDVVLAHKNGGNSDDSDDDSDGDEDEDHGDGKPPGSGKKGSEADQKKRQFVIMEEIFSRAPKAAG
ncbi:MAG: hypothetical protein SGBAC_005888, partial [Bacillariaceae sp.]